MSLAVNVVCPDCHAYLSVAAERDQFSGEMWPIDDEVPQHGCEAKP